MRPRTLAQVHATFRHWLGPGYDLQALDAVLATAMAERLTGDPCWLLVVSGSGAAKTETVGALAGAGALVTSTITSQGAMLSATAKRERSRDATGGLLAKIGPRGLLVVKDFTSILTMGRDVRAGVLAALREVYDGRWERNVGTDGGRTLTWEGRLVLIGAVTTAYDTAHSVIATMGDRFALVRTDSMNGRLDSGRQALRNVGQEVQMRAELAGAVGGLLRNTRPEPVALDDTVNDVLLRVADLVTRVRSAVERDHHGNVIDAHAPEMPTRFAKMLGQLVRGALVLGCDPDAALATAFRVARDTMPPLRLAVLRDVASHPGATTSDVTRRLQRPRQTLDRTLQELHALELVVVDTEDKGTGWRYRVADRECLDTLDALTRNVSRREGGETAPTPTDFSGEPTLTRNVSRREGGETAPTPTDFSGEPAAVVA